MPIWLISIVVVASFIVIVVLTLADASSTSSASLASTLSSPGHHRSSAAVAILLRLLQLWTSAVPVLNAISTPLCVRSIIRARGAMINGRCAVGRVRPGCYLLFALPAHEACRATEGSQRHCDAKAHYRGVGAVRGCP